jgi:hypothetical protein
MVTKQLHKENNSNKKMTSAKKVNINKVTKSKLEVSNQQSKN